MEAPEATLDPFRTVSEEVFSETQGQKKRQAPTRGSYRLLFSVILVPKSKVGL
jgi:hypothetical protein